MKHNKSQFTLSKFFSRIEIAFGIRDNKHQCILSKFFSKIGIAFEFLDKQDQSNLSKFFSRIGIAFGLEDNKLDADAYAADDETTDNETTGDKKIANKKVKIPHQIFDGLDFKEQMDYILETGNVGDEIEYISNNQTGVEKYKIILNESGEKKSQFVSSYADEFGFGGSKRKSKKGTKRKSNKRK